MNKKLIGKKVSIKESTLDGTVERMNLRVIDIDGCVVTIEDMDGKIHIVNLSSPNIIELKEC